LKLSLIYYPDDTIDDALAIVRLAEELGFYACYMTDFPYRKDVWGFLAAAARATHSIRLGPNTARVLHRDPVLCAQALATLDELSNGRVEALIGAGGDLPNQARPLMGSAQKTRRIGRLKEADAVMRLFFERDTFVFDGEFYQYRYRDMRFSARPVQSRISIGWGTMGGPLITTVAAQMADGVHVGPAKSRHLCRYIVERVKRGATRAGRDWTDLDIGVCPVWCCSPNAEAARAVARIQTAFYLPIMAPNVLPTCGIDSDSVAAIGAAWERGDLDEAVNLVSDDMMNVLAIAGTPEDCLKQVKENILGTGVNHLVLMVTDAFHTELISNRWVRGVPNIEGQLKLLSSTVLRELLELTP